MNIVGTGKNVIDASLLSRLAVDRQSGNTVSKAEISKAISDVKADLKDSFVYSARGLARAQLSIVNTLELAVKSGWVRGGSAKEMINAFVDGADKGSLSATVKEVRAEVRAHRAPRGSSYGGYRSNVSRPRRTAYAGT